MVSLRILRNVAAWALPRPSATASAKLANTTVNHSQKLTAAVNQSGCEPWRRRNQIAQQDECGEHAANLDDEHDWVLDDVLRRQFAEALPDCRLHDLGIKQ